MTTLQDPTATLQHTDDAYRSALDFLYGRINYERLPARGVRDFKLDRAQALFESLGHPELAIPAVHIAGTKGKGSTAAMVAAMLTRAGYRVGLFTSPHIRCFEERLTVDGVEPSPTDVIALVDHVRDAAAKLDARGPEWSPTFFELTAAMAWRHFAERRADLAVLEVGLGGRLDVTNLCRPLATVITSISFDHMDLLGDTLAKIAREKAGIIKPDVPVISGVEDPEAQEVIAETAANHSARLLHLGDDIQITHARPSSIAGIDRFRCNVVTPWRSHENVLAPLPGLHQARNAALALATVDCLGEAGWTVASSAMTAGLATVRLPLRIEILQDSPLTVADAAHNGASISALVNTVRGAVSGRKILIFGSARDKDVMGMLSVLRGEFDRFILTQFRSNPRALPVQDLAVLAQAAGIAAVTVTDSPEAAWQCARAQATNDDLICATGSLFLAAEVRNLVHPPEPIATALL